MKELHCNFLPQSPEHIEWYRKRFDNESSDNSVSYHVKYHTKENPACIVVIYNFIDIAGRTFRSKAIDSQPLFQRKPSFEEMYANHYPNWRVTFFKYFSLDELIDDEMLNDVPVFEMNQVIRVCRNHLKRKK